MGRSVVGELLEEGGHLWYGGCVKEHENGGEYESFVVVVVCKEMQCFSTL